MHKPSVTQDPVKETANTLAGVTLLVAGAAGLAGLVDPKNRKAMLGLAGTLVALAAAFRRV